MHTNAKCIDGLCRHSENPLLHINTADIFFTKLEVLAASLGVQSDIQNLHGHTVLSSARQKAKCSPFTFHGLKLDQIAYSFL